MSQTFEYPPAFVGYRPLQHHNKVILETLYRLRHHFFLTRLKYAVQQIASLPFTDRRRAGLKTAIVSFKCSHYYKLGRIDCLFTPGACSYQSRILLGLRRFRSIPFLLPGTYHRLLAGL